MATEQAFSTDNPDTVAAYLDAVNEYTAFARRIVADAKALGKNKGVLRDSNTITDSRVIGLEPDNPTAPPEGWAYLKSRERLEPKRGKAGEPARAWIADHKPPPDMRTVLEAKGLPRNWCSGTDGMRRRIGLPEVFLHDATLWAHYRGKPGQWTGQDDQCTWTPRRLSEYHAAREAFEAASEAVASRG